MKITATRLINAIDNYLANYWIQYEVPFLSWHLLKWCWNRPIHLGLPVILFMPTVFCIDIVHLLLIQPLYWLGQAFVNWGKPWPWRNTDEDKNTQS